MTGGKRGGRIIWFFLLAAIFFYPVGAYADDFPQRPIRMSITYSVGGGTDVLGRAFQRPFEEALGTKIIVDNIPAGTTKIGTLEAIKAKPDGYTIILMPDSGWVTRYYSGTFDFKVYEKRPKRDGSISTFVKLLHQGYCASVILVSKVNSSKLFLLCNALAAA